MPCGAVLRISSPEVASAEEHGSWLSCLKVSNIGCTVMFFSIFHGINIRHIIKTHEDLLSHLSDRFPGPAKAAANLFQLWSGLAWPLAAGRGLVGTFDSQRTNAFRDNNQPCSRKTWLELGFIYITINIGIPRTRTEGISVQNFQ